MYYQKNVKSKAMFFSALIAIVVQASAGIWWLAQLSQRVSITEQWMKDAQSPIGSIDKIEARLDSSKENINDLEIRMNLLESSPARHISNNSQVRGSAC